MSRPKVSTNIALCSISFDVIRNEDTGACDINAIGGWEDGLISVWRLPHIEEQDRTKKQGSVVNASLSLKGHTKEV